ncbi:MAG: site-2 protease family protein [Burkholderiales bacterium]
MNDIIQTIAVYALPVLLAITLHEAAHGYVAKYFGDKTAYMLGRVSLNPAKHIDPFGTIALPILMFAATAATGSPMIFGYAKPVPVNFGKLRNPKRDMVWVALAGPAANFTMALMWLLLLVALRASHINETFFLAMANAGVLTNLVIFALNLFPLPPLDGGRVLVGLLPHKYAFKVAKIEPYGFFIVMILAMTNLLFSFWVAPLMAISGNILQLIISPLNFLLN